MIQQKKIMEGADIYILDMSNTDIPLHVYSSMIPAYQIPVLAEHQQVWMCLTLKSVRDFFTSDATLTLK